jgi:PAS domain S-box-containing protein
MTRPLRALLIEDSEDDALLLLRELRRGGFAVEWERVDNDLDLRGALTRGPWDVVFSDFHMPGFSAQKAFATVKAHAADVPFIIVSGTLGEEAAVAAMRQGVDDYLSKGRLSRLAPAVERELAEAANRRAQRALEARLNDTQRQLEQIVSSIPDVFWSSRVEPGGRATLTFVSPSSRTVLGADPERFLARPTLWLSLIEPQDQAEARAAMRRVIVEGRGATLTYRVRVGGEVRWIENTVFPYVDGGVVTALRGVARDTTARRTMEEHLMLADRMVSVGTLAAGVAHEINNPLAVVLAGLEFVSESLVAVQAGGLDQLGEARDALREAIEGAARVRSIVKDLKLFSRADDERRGPVDMRVVLDSSVRMAWNEIRHRARLTREYGDVPPVEANEGRLGQVFLNLLINAAQSIDEGRLATNEIRVTTATDPEGNVVVEVRDTGCGMPPEVLGRIFDPFFTTKPIGVGTGLGLAICHRIVRGFDGDISVTSEPGVGSLFRVTLPRAKERGDTRQASLPVPSVNHGRVLVVDDEPAIGTMIRRALGRDLEVRATTKAAEALAWVAEGQRFDVIFCDLMMPEVTGMDLFAELRRTAPDLAARVVFVTGGAFTQRAREFLDAVPNARLEKPFDLRSIQALVRERVG